jgi:hypothetical protein
MATFEKRTTRDGMTVWRVKVRRKGAPPQTATFSQLSEAKKWAQITEGAVLEGRHFTTSEAKRHTLSEVIDRYLRDVLPHKRSSTAVTVQVMKTGITLPLALLSRWQEGETERRHPAGPLRTPW